MHPIVIKRYENLIIYLLGIKLNCAVISNIVRMKDSFLLKLYGDINGNIIRAT